VIADAHHVSVRYLYKPFEGRHRGVAGWIPSGGWSAAAGTCSTRGWRPGR
jgi:hypothetical protein